MAAAASADAQATAVDTPQIEWSSVLCDGSTDEERGAVALLWPLPSRALHIMRLWTGGIRPCTSYRETLFRPTVHASGLTFERRALVADIARTAPHPRLTPQWVALATHLAQQPDDDVLRFNAAGPSMAQNRVHDSLAVALMDIALQPAEAHAAIAEALYALLPAATAEAWHARLRAYADERAEVDHMRQVCRSSNPIIGDVEVRTAATADHVRYKTAARIISVVPSTYWPGRTLVTAQTGHPRDANQRFVHSSVFWYDAAEGDWVEAPRHAPAPTTTGDAPDDLPIVQLSRISYEGPTGIGMTREERAVGMRMRLPAALRTTLVTAQREREESNPPACLPVELQ